MTTAEKMNVPLSSLAIFLMICSLGCVMRASKTEIFGHPDRTVAAEAKRAGVSPPRDTKDLTCSRLQSELYRESLLIWLILSLCGISSLATMLVHVQSDSGHHPGPGPDQRLPPQLGTRSGRLVADGRSRPAVHRDGSARRSCFP